MELNENAVTELQLKVFKNGERTDIDSTYRLL